MGNLLGEYNGVKIFEYTLSNDEVVIKFLNIGGAITSIETKDHNGKMDNIVLAHENIENYLKSVPNYLGALIGRTAGRIPDNKITIDNVLYNLSTNKEGTNLHGGKNGFSKKSWDVKKISDNKYSLSYFSKDLEEGYPGDLDVNVFYTLDNNNFIIKYEAESTKDTIVNLTNHSYFNLSSGKELSTSHDLYINAAHILEMDENVISTGNVIKIKDTPYDFLTKKLIKKDMDKTKSGYDNCFLLTKDRNINEPAAILSHEKTKRRLSLFTDQPAVIFYNDGSADDSILNFGEHKKYLGICLETQNPTISMNEKFKELSLLKKGDVYTQKTIYKFDVID